MNPIQILFVRALRKLVYPLLPPNKRLAFEYRLFLLHKDAENELRYLDRILTNGETAIDVGANQGLYSYAMSKCFKKVYSFEINDEITRDLAAYNPGNITIFHKGLSSHDGSATLYIPVLHGEVLNGWASLAPGNNPDTQEHIEKPVQIVRLDSLNFDNISLIKIDVEGHEAEVLKGSVETLKRNKPVVITEIRPENLAEIMALFDGLGYQQKPLRDFVAASDSDGNYIFVPK